LTNFTVEASPYEQNQIKIALMDRFLFAHHVSKQIDFSFVHP